MAFEMRENLSLEIYEDSVESLQHSLSIYLYRNVNKKLLPITYRKNCLRTKFCTKEDHVMKRMEKKYGEIMMIIDVCVLCGHGIGEVFPVRRILEKVIVNEV